MPKKEAKRAINEAAKHTNETQVIEKSHDDPPRRRSARLVKTRQQPPPSTYNDHGDDDEFEGRSFKRRYDESEDPDSDVDYKPCVQAHSESEEEPDDEVRARKPKKTKTVSRPDTGDSDSERKPFKLDTLAVNLSEGESSSSSDDFEPVVSHVKKSSQGSSYTRSESSSRSDVLEVEGRAKENYDNDKNFDKQSGESSNRITVTDDAAEHNFFSRNLEAISKIQKAHNNVLSKSSSHGHEKDSLQDVIANMLRENERKKDCALKDKSKTSSREKFAARTKQKSSAGDPTATPSKSGGRKRKKEEMKTAPSKCASEKGIQEAKNKKESISREKHGKPSKTESSEGARKTRAMTSPAIDTKQTDPSCRSAEKLNTTNIRKQSQKARAKQQSQQHSRTSDSDDLSESSDWEEVPASGSATDLDSYNPTIPSEGVEITLRAPMLIKKRKKHKFDPEEYVRLQINRRRKAIQEYKHKVHLLCLLAWGLRVNNILLEEELHATALSLMLHEFHMYSKPKTTYLDIERLLKLFRRSFSYKVSSETSTVSIASALTVSMSSKFTTCVRDYALLFLLILRALQLECRLCISLYPVALKTEDLLKPKPKPKGSEDEGDKNVDDVKPSCSKDRKNKQAAKKEKKKVHSDEGCTDEDFEPQKHKANRSNPSKTRAESRGQKKSGRSKVNGNDGKARNGTKKQIQEASDSDKSSGSKAASQDEAIIEHWVEVFCNGDARWVPADVVRGSVGTIVESTVQDPILYVLGFDHNNRVKDLTKKYASGWVTTVPKQRVNEKWWTETLESYLPLNRERDLAEDRQIENKLQKLPLPCSIAEFKNHPLYALKRHLLKFQAIYPSDAPTLGFIKGEAVYARECVQTLHSRETWLREARMVRLNEQPYKIVKARPKYDKLTGHKVTDQPLELFGKWQTEEYMPPIAFNGKVPRNAYGNVELYKPCMLPVGTVHLQVPGLSRVAAKLGIDCAPAVIGFEGHCRGAHPILDGWIVCEEFRDTLMEAWAEEQHNIEKRQAEKREKRIYDNWRRLIKAVLIRERLRAKYFDDD